MRLFAEHDGVLVLVLADVEELLEEGSRTVRIENVTRLLAAVRAAAHGLLPQEPVDPVRLERIAGRLRAFAAAARRLAEAAPPENEDVQRVLAALEELDL